MNGYKVLYIEDKTREIQDNCAAFFPELDHSREFQDARILDEIKGALQKTIPYLDIAADFKDALALLSEHAEDYLLFIVDRDLGERTHPIEEIKKLWASISSDKYNNKEYRSGDLLLEYLCMELGFSKRTILNRFRFLTGYPYIDKNTENFLATLHYSEKESNDLIISKEKPDEFNKLKKTIDSPIEFHIQKKHHDVFMALKEIAHSLSKKPNEHTINMIKALAYVEGAKLKRQHLEKPSTELLRNLVEAFRKALKEHTDSPDYFKHSINWLKKLNNVYDLKKGNISNLFKPSNYFGFHGSGTEIAACPSCESIHKKPKRNIPTNNPAYTFQQEHSHYADIEQMIYTITSQELHFNERNGFEGKRLELVVYGLCELLLFYRKIFNSRLDIDEKDRHRARIMIIVEILNKTEDGWVSIADLKLCTNYIGTSGLDESYLKELDFEIGEDDHKGAFRVKDEI